MDITRRSLAQTILDAAQQRSVQSHVYDGPAELSDAPIQVVVDAMAGGLAARTVSRFRLDSGSFTPPATHTVLESNDDVERIITDWRIEIDPQASGSTWDLRELRFQKVRSGQTVVLADISARQVPDNHTLYVAQTSIGIDGTALTTGQAVSDVMTYAALPDLRIYPGESLEINTGASVTLTNIAVYGNVLSVPSGVWMPAPH